MRLIDADHLRKWIINNWGEGWHGKTVDDIIDQIDREDTYEVVDIEQHGHWEKLYTNNYKCSVCGSWWTDDGDTYLIEFNYCPNCGAKMDEVEKKEIKKICILSNGTLKEEYDIPNVIRCKNCKHWVKDYVTEDDLKYYHGNKDMCIRFGEYKEIPMSADDFCSRGEKKDE